MTLPDHVFALITPLLSGVVCILVAVTHWLPDRRAPLGRKRVMKGVSYLMIGGIFLMIHYGVISGVSESRAALRASFFILLINELAYHFDRWLLVTERATLIVRGENG